MPEITVLYAGLLGLLSIVLSAAAGMYRGKAGIGFGDGGDADLAMRMRRHANFVEYVPLALVLIALLEMQSVSPTGIHVLGIMLVTGRVLHAARFDQGVQDPGRGIGAGLTALAILVASVWGIATFVMRWL